MLTFADDILLLPSTNSKLEEMLNGMDALLRNNFNLKINSNKTKLMR